MPLPTERGTTMMDIVKKDAETRLEVLLAVKKKLNKEVSFGAPVSPAHADVLSALFAAIDEAIGAEVHMLDGGD